MIKKGILMLLSVVIVLSAFTIAHATQVDGMMSNSGPALPAGLAVHVNPGGLGDALIYGYYNVRDGNLNFIRVVNTSTTYGVAAKVRFREGHDSNEVLDFFICLSAADQWSGWVVPGTPGNIISWDDDTPTYPATTQWDTIPFRYGNPWSSVSASDTDEGYFEIIGIDAWPDTPGQRAVDTSDDCVYVATAGNIGTDPGIDYNNDVPNSLFGNSYIFDVTGMIDFIETYAYNASALGDCRAYPVSNAGLGADDHPRLDDCDGDPTTGEPGLKAVNYALTKSNFYTMYDVEAMLGGDTTYIVTFPTKQWSIRLLGSGNPFDGTYDSSTGEVTDDCENVLLKVWDDEENTPTTQIGFSPPIPGEAPELCDEVNLMVVGSTHDSLLVTDLLQWKIDVESAGFDIGWIRTDLTAGGKSTTFNYVTAKGLPALGYVLQGIADSMSSHMLPMKYDVETEVVD